MKKERDNEVTYPQQGERRWAKLDGEDVAYKLPKSERHKGLRKYYVKQTGKSKAGINYWKIVPYKNTKAGV